MSGHSHWSSIKHKKGAEDQKRGKLFSKLSREILVAVKEKGADPESNPNLRVAVEKAKEANMPKENIERAIKKGSGELGGESLEPVLFEAFGPGGVAIMIEGITDNKNRSLGEIRQILSQHGGKLVGEGSVRWMFERTAKKEEPGSMEWKAKQEIDLSEKDKESCQKLFEALDENEAVQEIYLNLKN